MYEDEEEGEEEEERCCEYDVGRLRITFEETEETLEGGAEGACCFSPRGGGNSGLLPATMIPWSLWTTAVSRLSAWPFSSALSVIIAAGTIFWLRW